MLRKRMQYYRSGGCEYGSWNRTATGLLQTCLLQDLGVALLARITRSVSARMEGPISHSTNGIPTVR
jgi:hypothetical protein